jgi:spermidine synthase
MPAVSGTSETLDPSPAWPLRRTHTNRRYYSADVHKAAFVLPRYAHDALASSLTHV